MAGISADGIIIREINGIIVRASNQKKHFKL